ncbi:MAG: Cache 3/Cache 2 fusion domain-containing protein [Betaproteobacteria bacterium]|nr:Cache 3/Cache 2 fusion domain-containing protein [Betaproteobacteria bacterium]
MPVSVLVVVTTLVLVAIISISNSRSIEQSAQRESLENLSKVRRVLAVTDTIMMERVKGSMKLLMERGGSIGAPRQGHSVEIKDRTAPDLIFGSQAQANRFELVDGVTSSQGGTATLFSKEGENFVRISTNVRQGDKRAVGTVLDPNGQAIKAIRADSAFYGQVDILGTPFLTGYEPMRDSQNNIVGLWYVGYKVDMQALQESIAQSRILNNGFIALMDDKGKVRFHSDNVAPEVALSVANGSVHGWEIKKETFTPWGFVMVAAYPKDEVSGTVRREVFAVVAVGVVLGCILIGLLIWLARSLVIAPLKEAVAVAGEIANGNLTATVISQREDEIGVLLKALNHMQASLLQMIERITSNAHSIDKLEAAKQHLQNQDQLKSDFLSSVSHELRTPLTSIRGFAHLVEREFSRSFAALAGDDAGLNKKSERIRENLAIILKESDRLSRLINDVLDLAKIEAGRVDWHDAPIQPGVLVRDAVNAAHGMFEQKPGVELKVEVQDNLPLFVGDADRMLQVLINLLNNAAKFTDRGTVAVQAFLNSKNLIQIDIRDSGIGFPPEEAEAIFDKFQQAKHGDTLTDRPKGTGLGLAISREIVERHDGKIQAQSQPGEGSVFTVLLPPATESLAKTTDITSRIASLATEEQRRTMDEGMPSDKSGKPRVLVVDDDEGVRDYLTQLLQEQDYDVISAADGQAAVAAAQAYRPDLITMDIAMPVMDGRTAIAKLRADPGLQHIPIMVVSALPGWDTAGGDLAMPKPLDEPHFLKNIHLLLGRSESAEAKKMHFLVLYDMERDSAMAPSGLSAHCEMDFCPLDELSARIQSGFQGMVVVPTDLLDKVDLHMLNVAPSLEVMIMPVQMAMRTTPAEIITPTAD